MDVFEKTPHADWKLKDWRSAADIISPQKMLTIGATLESKILRDIAQEWKESTVQSWLRKHISARPHAYAMIAVLREGARREGGTLFSDENLRKHADLFMRSAACREGGFYYLDEHELAEISGGRPPDIDPRYMDDDLLRKVFPPPPIRPFGRDKDIAEIIKSLQESPITVIVSNPGNGKTTAAWHSSRYAVINNMFVAMDWNTAKRSIITAYGASEIRQDGPVDISIKAVISSALNRFGWHDFKVLPEDKLKALFAQRMNTGRYLIVVDNLETVPEADKLVAELRGLIESRSSYAPALSRILITSRVPVTDMPDVRNIHLDGLELEPSGDFIRALEKDNDYSFQLSASQVSTLWDITKGNPLLIQIALTRMSRHNSDIDKFLRDSRQGANFMDVFDQMFGPLVTQMVEEQPKAAILASYGLITPDKTLSTLRDLWGREFEPDEEKFQHALNYLINNGMIQLVPNTDEEYTSHPAIIRYIEFLAAK